MPTVTYKVIEIEHNQHLEEVGQQVLYRGPHVNLALYAADQPALVAFSEKRLFAGSKHCFRSTNWPTADPNGPGYDELLRLPLERKLKLSHHTLNALEVKALALLLRFVEAGETLEEEPLTLVPSAFTQKEMEKLKNMLYAVDSGEGEEIYLEDLSLPRLLHYLLMRIGDTMPPFAELSIPMPRSAFVANEKEEGFYAECEHA